MAELFDKKVHPSPKEKYKKALLHAGYGERLSEEVAKIYSLADGATFCDGALRIYPFEGEHGLPDLIIWNDEKDWKKYSPTPTKNQFYFLSNSFGDLFGIPLDAKNEIEFDRVAYLDVGQYKAQQIGKTIVTFLASLKPKDELAEFYGRIPAHKWAGEKLGIPHPWQCFSANVPILLGGANSLDNVSVAPLPVHVSFTLQLLKQFAEGKLKAGDPLPKVDVHY
jgi:hypothetical protein